jgi:glycerol-3-phosphate acyltransferase PlsX
VGNIEPKELVKGEADVVITDGFTGNIHIKTAEAVASFIKGIVKRDLLGKSLTVVGSVLLIPSMILGIPGMLCLLPGIKKMAKRLDYSEVGGALLLGVNGVVIVGHGRSNSKAVKNAILRAREAVEANIIPTIISGLEQSSMIPEKTE